SPGSNRTCGASTIDRSASGGVTFSGIAITRPPAGRVSGSKPRSAHVTNIPAIATSGITTQAHRAGQYRARHNAAALTRPNPHPQAPAANPCAANIPSQNNRTSHPAKFSRPACGPSQVASQLTEFIKQTETSLLLPSSPSPTPNQPQPLPMPKRLDRLAIPQL